EERRDREDRDADVEDAAAPEQGGRPSTEPQGHAEGELERGDHPLQVRLGEVQRLADRRQRDVDDRDVEDGHEKRRTDDRERLPPVRIWHRDGSYEKGRGVADTLGMETRAIVENSCGRHAWQMFASQATDRKMKASSIVKPHWSTRKRAPSSTARSSASMKSGPAVPCTTQRSASSVTGHVPCLPFSGSMRIVTSPAISTPVKQTSPSPIDACMSPIASMPPGWRTGRNTGAPGPCRGLSRLPAACA